MKYRFIYTEAVLEFLKNEGCAVIDADTPEEAVNATRSLFPHIRNVQVKPNQEAQFLITFKVSLDYRLPFLREVERAIKMLRDPELYGTARYLDRYIVATICYETGCPEWLKNSYLSLKEEISTLRKSAVVAREVSNVRDFVDWDIAIYNYLELNSKEGYKSRILRKCKPQ